MQALPLKVKILLTKARIRDWVNEYGTDGVYISFSGGKDSTVLLTIAREIYPNIKAVFSDTGLEYPEIRDFVRTWDNVDWVRPKKTFRQVIEEYGYPFISKEVSERVYYAQRYLTWYRQTDRQTDRPPTDYSLKGFLGTQTETIPLDVLDEFINSQETGTYKISRLLGKGRSGEASTRFNFERWKALALCPYTISNKCCAVTKKRPMNAYAKETGRYRITGQMAEESQLRTTIWLKHGCNGFDMKSPVSNPMSFWTEQDVLRYIKETNTPISSVYGEIVTEDSDGFEYTATLTDTQRLKTTGVRRTGCMFCGFGCHLEKSGEGRFERMKVTHPKVYEYVFRDWDKGGLGYKQVIDWINENCETSIRY